jgi:adenosylhomocysteine nucleosidase
MRFIASVVCLLLALVAPPLGAADRLDSVPRVAVVCAFEPEWKVLKASLGEAKSHSINGVEFITGTLSGRKVVLFLSGISLVNAAMNTQLALDRFDVTGIVVSGIAGGVDPNLQIGDVAVAARWGQYLEAVFAREVDGKFQLPPWAKAPFPNYGMIFPGDIGVRSAKGAERRFWFDADAGMLAAAGRIGAIDLKRCTVEQACLSGAPRLVVGPGLRRQCRLPPVRVQDLRCPCAGHGKRSGGHGRLRQRRAVHRLPQPLGPRRRRPGRQRGAHVFPSRLGQFGSRGAAVPDALDAAAVIA